MTYYQSLGLSSSDICAAVAAAIIHDARINCLGIEGFPQIAICRNGSNDFNVTLRWEESRRTFTLSEREAKHAVDVFKNKMTHDTDIFDRVQKTLAELEGVHQ
jgi:hypothetical protein